MTIHIKVSGVWQTVTDPQVKVSGVWQPVQEGWVKVSGVWEQFFARVVYQAVAATINSTDSEGFTVTGTLFYDSDGGVRKTQESAGSGSTTDVGEWSSAHPSETGGAGYSVRLTHQTGVDTYSSGSGLGTWVTLGSDRSWNFSGPSSGPSTELGTYLLEIREGTDPAFDSATITVSLENTGP